MDAESDLVESDALSAIDRRLDKMDIGPMIRRQTAVEVRSGARAVPLFRECFLPLDDVRLRLATRSGFPRNKWLIRHVVERLDRAVLACHAAAPEKTCQADVPLCLTSDLATLQGAELDRFRQATSGRCAGVVFQVTLADRLADRTRYAESYERLQRWGYRILIDGLDLMMTQYLSVAELDADFVKIRWKSEQAKLWSRHDVRDLQDRLVGPKAPAVVLADVKSVDALEWGVEAGIRRFQGALVDQLVSRGPFSGRVGGTPQDGSISP